MEVTEKVVFTSAELMKILGIGVTSFWKLTRLKVFVALPHIKRRKLYPAWQLWAYVNQSNSQDKK